MTVINLGAALCVFSLYFMAAGIPSMAFGARQEVFLPLFGLCVAAQTIGAAMHRLPKWVRLLAVAPVILGLFFCRTLPEYLLLPVPLVIVAVTQLTGKYSLDYHDFKSLFFKLLPVVFFLLFALWLFEYMGSLGVYFAMVYIIAGILTLRMLRQDAEVYSSFKFTLINSLPLILFTVLMAVLGSGNLLSAALSGVGWLLKMIGRGILAIFGAIGYLFLRTKESLQEIAGEAEETEAAATQPPVNESHYSYSIGENRDSTAILIAIAAIIILIAAALITLYIIRHNKNVKASRSGRSLEKRTRYRAPGGSTSRGFAETETAKSSRGIRATYKKWLKLLKKRRVEFKKADTSLDILDKRAPSTVPYEAHKTLRELYVKARYHEGYAATHEEQHAAKEAYEKLAASDFSGLEEKKWE